MTFRIDPHHRIVFTTFTGTITFEQVVAHAVALKSDPRFHPSFSEFVDMRRATNADLSFQEIVELAETIDPFSPNARRAIVANADAVYGTGRMYQAARERGNAVGVFRTIEEANEWLGITADIPAMHTAKPFFDNRLS